MINKAISLPAQELRYLSNVSRCDAALRPAVASDTGGTIGEENPNEFRDTQPYVDFDPDRRRLGNLRFQPGRNKESAAENRTGKRGSFFRERLRGSVRGHRSPNDQV